MKNENEFINMFVLREQEKIVNDILCIFHFIFRTIYAHK